MTTEPKKPNLKGGRTWFLQSITNVNTPAPRAYNFVNHLLRVSVKTLCMPAKTSKEAEPEPFYLMIVKSHAIEGRRATDFEVNRALADFDATELIEYNSSNPEGEKGLVRRFWGRVNKHG